MRRRSRRTAALGLALGVAAGTVGPALAGGALTPIAFGDTPNHSVSTRHFEATGEDGAPCDVVADVYVPAGVDSAHRAPAILTTNGFGGSKNDLKPMAEMFTRRGYVVLAYSGLGFGGSGCRISFDTPDPDGRAAAHLVDYLGGKANAYLDAAHTQRAPALDVVMRDAVAHDGRAHPNDPRVGMVGGSYGGQVQFAAAAMDPRIDTITPMATWNDLSYSLAPNNTGQTVGVSTRGTGAPKTNWDASLVFAGVASGFAHGDVDPTRLTGCPNYPTQICTAVTQAVTTGVVTPDVVARLRAGSVASYLDRIRIPTLLLQGQSDTLFNLNEAIATYRGLTSRGVDTDMIWMSGGHSALPETGDYVENAPDPATQYVTRRIVAWMDHHLRGTTASPGPRFSYFRNWIRVDGDTEPAYAYADSVDVGSALTYRLSSTDRLATQGVRTRPGTARFVTPLWGLPTTHDHPDSLGLISVPERDVPGTAAMWDSAALAQPLDVVGSPRVAVRVSTTVPANMPAERQLVLFLRIVDVDAVGNATTVGNLVAPARIADPSRPVTVTMPAIVHRFETGHRLRLVISGGSTNYRGGQDSLPVAIPAGDGQTVTVPVIGGA
ncbi:CocE/NonD family hydrolase [Gordonia sp. NPDC003950]